MVTIVLAIRLESQTSSVPFVKKLALKAEAATCVQGMGTPPLRPAYIGVVVAKRDT